MKKNILFSEALNVLCVVWVLLHIYEIMFLPISIDQFKVVHLGFACVIVFAKLYLDRMPSSKYYPKVLLLVLVISFSVTIYFFVDNENMTLRLGTPSTIDIFAGTIWISVVLIGTYLAWGFVIPLLVILVSFYAVFGNYTSGIFFHSGIDFPRFIGYSSTYFMGTLGTLTNLSATLIVQFLLFGALLTALGGAEAINKIALIVGSRFRSGTAQTAVLSSCLVGMTTGSAPANVAITGAFTIPMMKRRGYSPEYAGAVEAVASAGGQMMPPIMSVVVFIMAGLTGIPLAQIIVAAFLPALIYFISLSFSVMVRTRKLNLPMLAVDAELREIKIKDILKKHGYLIIPVIVLTWRILIGESPHRAVFWGNASMVTTGLISNLYLGRNDVKSALLEFAHKFYIGTTKCASEAAKLALILGSVGIVMETFTSTGFGQRLSYEIVTMSGGLTLVLALLVAVLVLFFGMGMPTAGAYLVAVLLSAPALIKVGFPELSVHMYVFYFAVLSQLTPPVSLAVLVAISISGGKYGKTALIALGLALPGFVLPFIFLYQPALLGLAVDPIRALGIGILVQVSICGLILIREGYATRPVLWAVRRIKGKVG